jgi:hypothetical protein
MSRETFGDPGCFFTKCCTNIGTQIFVSSLLLTASAWKFLQKIAASTLTIVVFESRLPRLVAFPGRSIRFSFRFQETKLVPVRGDIISPLSREESCPRRGSRRGKCTPEGFGPVPDRAEGPGLGLQEDDSFLISFFRITKLVPEMGDTCSLSPLQMCTRRIWRGACPERMRRVPEGRVGLPGASRSSVVTRNDYRVNYPPDPVKPEAAGRALAGRNTTEAGGIG